jgi:hypothetical protein
MQQWGQRPGNTNQEWKITALANGHYTIANHTSGLVLDLTNGDYADGTAIQQWAHSQNNINQEWQFLPAD